MSVPPRDAEATAAALDRMLSNDTQRSTMGVAARQLWESRLTWDANTTALQKLFERAMSFSAGRG
jgi:glycosyltransferase involved in cell wall biosynthesis